MTRKELAEAVYDTLHNNLPLVETENVRVRAAADATVRTVINTIRAAIIRGETVEINSFGKFVAVERGARIGRNFQTGELMEFSPRRSVKFRPAKKLRAL